MGTGNVGPGKRILVADDDEYTRVLIGDLLRGRGHSVETAQSGAEALLKTRCADFDLVISDVNMGPVNGLDFYRRTVVARPMLKDRFLFITGETYAESEARRELDRLDVRCLVKPFAIKDLVCEVDWLLYEVSDVDRRNRRGEARTAMREDCRLTRDNVFHLRPFAETIDISERGLRIRFLGDPLKPESIVGVYIRRMNLRLEGAVVWSKMAGPAQSMAGLRLKGPVPPALDEGHGEAA